MVQTSKSKKSRKKTKSSKTPKKQRDKGYETDEHPEDKVNIEPAMGEHTMISPTS